MSKFKNQNTFEDMSKECRRILSKYKDRVPIIVEKGTSCKSLPDFDKNKYLVPNNITMGQFISTIRKRIQLEPTKAIFYFVDDTHIPSPSDSLETIYSKYKDPTGFLFLTVTGENVYG